MCFRLRSESWVHDQITTLLKEEEEERKKKKKKKVEEEKRCSSYGGDRVAKILSGFPNLNSNVCGSWVERSALCPRYVGLTLRDTRKQVEIVCVEF